ncbi:MAG: hypothetical protein AAFZ80_09305 [Cyanobacteria bacterium P01_A01_bin.105]
MFKKIFLGLFLRQFFRLQVWGFALGLSIALVLGLHAPAYAADVIFGFSTSVTGTAPFTPGDDGPGNDSSASNNIVRTLDEIIYKWDYAVNNGDADNTVLSATLSPDQEWTELPPACQTGSDIVINPDDTQTLTCNLGTISSGSNGFIEASARVIGQRPDSTYVANGDVVVGNGSFSSDTSNTETDGPVETIVSARPQADLRKNRASRVLGLRTGRDGSTEGVVIRYPLELLAGPNGKGSEPLVGDINITDTLLADLASDPNGIDGVAETPMPGAELYNWNGSRGCAWNYEPGQPELSEWFLPRGKVSAIPAEPERATTDSGDWSCSQPGGPASPITLTISGADTTGNHTPTKTGGGNSTLPATKAYLVSGTINIWVPTSVVLDNGGDVRLTNRYSEVTNQSVSGQTNEDPSTPGTGNDPDNNTRSFTLVAGAGSFNQYYARDIDARGSRLFPMTNLNSGDGVVMPTQNFTKRLYGRNTGILDWEDYRYCEKFDSDTLQLTPIPGDATSAVKVFNGGPSYNYVIEYGTGDENGNPGTYSSDTAMRTALCDDDDSAAGWFTDINAVPGGIDAITKIRFIALEPLPPNATMDLAVNFTARNFFNGTSDKIPNGEILPNFSAVSSPTLAWTQNNNSAAGGGWYYGTYNPETHGGTKAWGDRIFLSRSIVRITKETLPDDTVNTMVAGSTIGFRLSPTVNATVDPPPVTPTVVVRDILPAEFDFVAGSANLPPTSVTNNPDGTTEIVWDLGPRTPNQPLPEITFEAQARFDVPNNTQAVNTTVIESPDDNSPESARSDNRGVTIGNAAAFGIVKEVPRQLIEPDESFTYELKYANTGTVDVGPGIFIDILPHATDGRVPATDFAGAVDFVSIVGTNGETFEYTKANPTTINTDPTHASNQPGGATVWCTGYTGGACPASPAEVTGIRMFTPTFPQGQPTRTVVLTMDTDSNVPANTYTNSFDGRVDGLIGLLQSNDVFVQVRVPSSLLLVKRITAINGDPLTLLVDDPGDPDDNDPNWPSGYLQGEIDGGFVTQGNEIEYTIYFLSNGGTDSAGVTLCDLVPVYSTFINNAFNGNPASPFGIPGSDLGIELSTVTGVEFFSSANDGDAGTFFGPGEIPSTTCSAANDNGAVVVDVGDLSHVGTGGTTSASYGYIRFKAQVN